MIIGLNTNGEVDNEFSNNDNTLYQNCINNFFNQRSIEEFKRKAFEALEIIPIDNT